MHGDVCMLVLSMMVVSVKYMIQLPMSHRLLIIPDKADMMI